MSQSNAVPTSVADQFDRLRLVAGGLVVADKLERGGHARLLAGTVGRKFTGFEIIRSIAIQKKEELV